MKMENTGIPVNHEFLLDAVVFKGADCDIVDGDSFHKGQAVQSTKSLVTLMDTGELPVGTIVGPQTITILWDTDDTSGEKGIHLEVVKNGYVEYSIQYGIEPTEVYHGTVIQYDFDAESTYRFIITSLKSATTTLDFVKLTPVFPGSVVNATRRVIGDFEAMEVIDRGAGSMSGGGDVTVAASVPFNLPFSEAPNVFAQATHYDLNASVKNVTSSGFTIEVTHVRGVAWSGTYTIYWVAFGGVTRPYAPGLPL